MRLKCPGCKSTLFYLHYPPKGVNASRRVLILICDSCQKLHENQLRNVELVVDAEGTIRGIRKTGKNRKEASP